MNYICLVRIKSCLAQYCKHVGGCFEQQQNEVINISFSSFVKNTLKDCLLRSEDPIDVLTEKILTDQPDKKNTQLVFFGYPSLQTERITKGNYQNTARTIYYLGKYGSALLADCIESIYITNFINDWKKYKELNDKETFHNPEKRKFIKSFMETNEISLSGNDFISEEKRLSRTIDIFEQNSR